jgi:hypothetical protein
MSSVLRVRTFLYRLKGSRPHRERTAATPPRGDTARREGSEPGRGQDDSLGRWEVDGGRLPGDA